MVENNLNVTSFGEKEKKYDENRNGGTSTPELLNREDEYLMTIPSMPSMEEMSDTRLLIDEEDTEMKALYTQLKSCGMYLGGIESPKFELSDQ